jgi:uncharacterized repeat protein (TIGR01451 family)
LLLNDPIPERLQKEMLVDPSLATARRSRRRRSITLRGALVVLLAPLMALAGLGLSAPTASAVPVYEITGQWEANTPTTVKSGDIVTAIWRVNVNDDQPAPANDPVDNVTFTVTAQNGTFSSLPRACETAGVAPASSISPDGKTLTCNLGTHDEGTAVVVQAPMLADGPTGSQVTATGSIAGQSADLEPIDIVNPFGMDMRWGVGTRQVTSGAGFFGVDLEWTLSKLKGSDPGQQTLSYNLTIDSVQGPVSIAAQNCTAFTTDAADGHPWSGGNHPANQMDSFVGSCTLTQVDATHFTLTLSGIDYNPANPPTRDSTGRSLPVDQVALASGSIWLRIATNQSGSVQLTQAPMTYTSADGTQTASDNTSNNTESKAWVTPGGYSEAWQRSLTGNGGTSHDDTYKVAAGTTVYQAMDTSMPSAAGRDPSLPVGFCSIIDNKYADFTRIGGFNPAGGVPGQVIEYYTGGAPALDATSASYDPNSFNCGVIDGGWSTTPPADLTQVKAVRIAMTQAQAKAASLDGHVGVTILQTIQPDAPTGIDVWSLMNSINDDGSWTTHPGTCGTPIPDGRYCLTGYTDVLHVVTASPAVSKSVDRSVVKPGEAATYTLTYSANGAGALPPSVDGYQLVDTLPVGMAYVAGSATPEPVVTTSGGHEVLTWTLDGVTTNANHALTYQAALDNSVTPGQVETNTVAATYGGVTANAAAQVTVATDGYTQISKTADTPFIPNLDGKGNGEGSWTVSVRSFDPLPQAFTDTIDILPFRGDARGTDYEGDYALVAVTPNPGANVFYTTADPATLSDDPGDPVNGSAGDPVGNSVGWSPVFTADATAVRVIGPQLAPGAEQQFKVAIATAGADGEDVFVNRAQGRAGHTQLVMRTSAPITVADYYSASLKKYVQDRSGKWHDANDAADYPVFNYGDTVKYRIVVTNTGQGTLTNLDISDDKQPQLGGFHVDSLAPGESASHEYSMKLGTSVSGTVVNTACATADTPADSQVPPTINCDPAGLLVANYTTVKTSDPASGSMVYPGQVVRYTVVVTQQGSAPAAASLSDDLAGVFDDAVYNRDVRASLGQVAIHGSRLVWSGTVPVGGKATITYSVRVKALKALKAHGDRRLGNVVTSDGCRVVGGRTVGCETQHRAGIFDLAVTKRVIGSHLVIAGGRVRYGLRVLNRGPNVSSAPVRVTDRLPRGLELVSAHGKGWACQVDKRDDRLVCVRATSLRPHQHAPRIVVVAKATRKAIGHRVVNVARVSAAGDTVKSNNRSTAAVEVIRTPALPSTGYRTIAPTNRWLA